MRASQSFSSTWGWVRFAPGDAWNLPSEGTGVGLLPAGQSGRRGQCAGTGPFNSLHCARVWTDIRTLHMVRTTTTTVCVTVMFQNPSDGSCADRVLGSSAARRRRERRLRSMFWPSFRTILQGNRGWPGPGCGGTSRTTRRRSGKPPTPQPELFSLEEEPGRGLPAPLSEVAGRQDKVVRHVMEDLGSVCPFVQILDLPVPADGGLRDGRLADAGSPDGRAGYRSAHDPPVLRVLLVLLFLSRRRRNSCADRAVSHAHRLADRGADRRHSCSSGSWRAAWSRFSSQDRVQQRFLLPNAFLSGLWSRTLTFLLVLALDRGLPHLLVLQMRILLGFFALFTMEKSAECRAGGECAAG